MNLSTTGQAWLDTELYPFESNFIELSAGRMHYIDQGEGDLILFVHGTPTWSFLYRDMIKALSKNYRCVAIDHLGFGLSDKPEDFDGKAESHSANLSEFINRLGLDKITLVVHDFGGPIGLGAGIRQSEKMEKIILMNTWLWETKSNPKVVKLDNFLRSTLGKFLYLRMNFSPKVLLKKGFSDKSNLGRKLHKQYVYPFPDKKSRFSLLKLAKSLLGSSEWYQEQYEHLYKLESKPWLILWGLKDEYITKEYLERWKTIIPKASVREYDCGHFLQEEKPSEVIQEIDSFMKSN